jgi:hypothetical protein
MPQDYWKLNVCPQLDQPTLMDEIPNPLALLSNRMGQVEVESANAFCVGHVHVRPEFCERSAREYHKEYLGTAA